MRLPRKNPDLNDAIEVLDRYLEKAHGDTRLAWSLLSPSERTWIDSEIERCLDRDYFISNYFYMITQNGEAKALYPYWPHQEMVSEAIRDEWAKNGCCKMIILKGRQAGISTWIQGAIFHHALFNENCFALIVAQDRVTSEHVYGMSVKGLENLPWFMRPEWRYKSKAEGVDFQREDDDQVMYDPGLGSVLKISHAAKMSGIAIGRSVRAFHGSETSRWPNPEVFEADILPSMNALDGFYILESTGYGKNGLFYDWWQDTVNGDTDWRALFIPAWRVTRYYLPIRPMDKIVLTETEQKFHDRIKKEENFEIPLGFWKFRHFGLKRSKKKKSGFLESYPITPDEAFQNSGLCAFDRDALDEQAMRAPKNPAYAGEIRLVNNKPDVDIREVSPGEDLPVRKRGKGGHRLHVWEPPQAGESYYVGSDAALGNGGDYSVCEVFKAGPVGQKDVQVAEWWGWESPKRFAHIVAALGYWYNGAEITNEYNGPGITTGDALVDMDYPNLWRPRHKDRVQTTFTPYLHWVTSIKTRDLVIDEMRDALLTDSVIINSHDLLAEMGDFATLDEGPGRKRYEGVDSNDDGVMASTICLYCLRESLQSVRESPRESADLERDPTGKIWGVVPFSWRGPWVIRDQAMRPVQVFQRKEEAEKAIEGKQGYSIGPHWAFAAANPYISPIHQSAPQGYLGSNMQYQAKRVLGIQDTEVTPGLVSAFKQWQSTMRSPGAEDLGGYNDDW